VFDETGPTAEGWRRQEELVLHAEAVRAVLGDDPTFTQLGIDDDLDGLVLHATARPSPSQWEACERAAPGVRLRYVQAVLSDAQLQHLFALVSERRADLLAGGVLVRLAGPLDGYAGPFVLCHETGEPTAEMVASFEIFGPGTVEFRRIPPGSVRSLGSEAPEVGTLPGVVSFSPRE